METNRINMNYDIHYYTLHYSMTADFNYLAIGTGVHLYVTLYMSSYVI